MKKSLFVLQTLCIFSGIGLVSSQLRTADNAKKLSDQNSTDYLQEDADEAKLFAGTYNDAPKVNLHKKPAAVLAVYNAVPELPIFKFLQSTNFSVNATANYGTYKTQAAIIESQVAAQNLIFNILPDAAAKLALLSNLLMTIRMCEDQKFKAELQKQIENILQTDGDLNPNMIFTDVAMDWIQGNAKYVLHSLKSIKSNASHMAAKNEQKVANLLNKLVWGITKTIDNLVIAAGNSPKLKG